VISITSANNTNRHRSNDPMNIGTGIGKPRSDGVIVSSQMILATYQYLNACKYAYSILMNIAKYPVL